MTAFNSVRFRVKAGREQEFLDAHKKRLAWPGLRRVAIIKTDDRAYCLIAEWKNMAALVRARPSMIATLDTFRDTLEELSGRLGVTDAVSGDAVLDVKRAARPNAVAKRAAKRKTSQGTKSKRKGLKAK